MSNRPSLHVCIATGQNMANLIPALQYDADEVWILQTPGMREQHSGRHLAAAIKGRGIACRLHDFPDDSVIAINEAAAQLAEELDQRGVPVTINITGGTKLMTMALVQNLADMLATGDTDRVHVAYTDTASQKIRWLRPRVSDDAMRPVVEVLDVLRAYGYRIKTDRNNYAALSDGRLQIARERENLTRRIVEGAAQHAQAVSMVNRYAARAADETGALGQKVERMPQGNNDKARRAHEYLGWLEQANLLALDTAASHLEFMSREAARYCAGGWLEEFVALKADRAAIDGDWRANLQVEAAQSRTLNEIDLMVVHHNRTLVVECKAARNDDDKVNDWLSRLKDLGERVGGNHTTAMLVCMRALTDSQVGRAEELGVRVCHGKDLRRFAAHLDDWLHNG